MLKRAHGFAAAAALAIVAALGPVPIATSGCQSTCSSNADCGSSSYCSFSNGVCDNATSVGFCQSMPSSCPDTQDPVCGCDGKQYESACAAAQQRVSVSTTGTCSITCGGTSGLTCADTTSFCDLAVGTCGQPSAAGACTPIPTAASCPTFPAPVCGCDGKTYLNACLAAAVQVSVGSVGACPCGGYSGVTCAASEFCSYAQLGDCLVIGQPGGCEPRPTECSPLVNPVCGCDGTSYPNPCQAAVAGTSVAFSGSCSDGGI